MYAGSFFISDSADFKYDYTDVMCINFSYSVKSYFNPSNPRSLLQIFFMKVFLGLLLCYVCLGTSAQSRLVWGYLRDSATHEPIVLASVTNINTKQTVMTGNTGRFSIELAEKQVITFAAVGYHFDTIHFEGKYFMMDTLSLHLSPLTYSLANVTVTSRAWSRYQLDSIERRKDFLQGTVSYKIPTVSNANSGAGIGLNIDRFSRHERNKRKALAFFDTNEKEAYINYRFPASLVKRYTGFKDEKLQQFMQEYRPAAEWLRTHRTDEDIEYYINDKLKLFTHSAKPQ